MADYDIYANITANTKGYEAGIKKAQESTKKFGTSVSKVIQGLGKSGFVGALGAVGLASAGVTATLGAVVKVVKKVAQSIGECTEAFRTQTKVETALTVSVQNNPLVDGTASIRLKNFASEMQKVSDIGDEQLLPMMSDLIAKGRTETETMQIIKVATDMASTGTISFENAVSQLNATLNGNIGRLGQQNAELKTLTEEELKSGKAVEILGEKYKGLAKSTVDTSKQLKNAIGDFKEIIGETFENALAPMRKWFTEVITNTNNAIKSAREQKKAYAEVFGEDNNQVNLNAETEKLKTALDSVLDEQRRISTNYRQYLSLYGEYINKETDETLLAYEASIRDLNKKIAELSKELTRRKNESNAEAERRKQAQADAEAEQKLIDLKEEYLKKVAEQEAKWEHIKEVTGEQVSNEEKIKFYQDSLVDLMTQAGGQITTNNQLYKDQMAIIEKLAEGLEKQKKALADIASWEEKLRQQEIKRLSDSQETVGFGKRKENLKSILDLNLQSLEAQKEADIKSIKDTENVEEAKAKIVEYYNNEKLALQKDYNEELANIKNQEAEEEWRIQKEQYQKLAKLALDYVKKIGNAFSKIGQIVQNVFKGVVNYTKDILQKLFKGNINDLLDELLKFEDGILTFFVETLPQLPSFFASALQSVSVMLESVLQIITPEKISKIMISILQTIQQYAPTIIGAIAEIITNMLDGIINSLPQILDTLNVVVEKLAEVLPQLIQKLIDLFIGILQEPEKIADLVVTIIKAFVEIFKVILKNIGPLLEALLPAIGTLIIEIIKAIPDILASMAEALWEAVKGIGKFIVNMLIEVINSLLDGISAVWTWIPGTKGIPHIPKLATGTDDAKKGLALVGEAGPELVNFRGGEQVLNNRNTQKALAGMGNSGNTFNVTFNNTMDTTAYAMMSQLRQYNRQMAINSII